MAEPVYSLDLMRNVSGYGRELFVSNVIKFIGDSYPHILRSVFSEYLPSGDFRLIVKREWHRTDIAIFVNDNPDPAIIIENKIGAAISNQQLEKYSELIKGNGTRILLTLREPLEPVPGDWIVMRYDNFTDRLKLHLTEVGFEMEFLPNFIHYLQELHNDLKRIDNEWKDKLSTATLSSITSQKDLPAYEARAIFESLARILNKQLGDLPVSVEAQMTHSSPMLNVHFDEKADNDCEYIIQLQDNCLVVGFVIDNNGLFDESQNGEESGRGAKQKNRAKIWDEYAPKALKDLTGIKKSEKMAGYTTAAYVMPTVRLKRGDSTIQDVFDEIKETVEKLTKTTPQSAPPSPS